VAKKKMAKKAPAKAKVKSAPKKAAAPAKKPAGRTGGAELRSLDHVGEVVRALRKACGLKQEQLADMTGVHAITVSRLETGAITCGADSLYKLAQGLKLRPSSLVYMAEEFARTRGKALSDPTVMSTRFETIEGTGSWKSFVRRMASSGKPGGR
jgi:transcriptional regulator with XRE-family HTH domain